MAILKRAVEQMKMTEGVSKEKKWKKDGKIGGSLAMRCGVQVS